ncbi:MmgE/PrpD family protein [Pusillimonas sp. SM2304]|uniref:MmgE/PrpD family protein n=1 Tax=Pusillimonas sp. SM2304 TaxID=3073241 RepID=UPI0028762115|nr:MmgE/PrpD family protein [Pusillimonas sp. SM2304]MDS1138876.1 MmgE/PrpD family protein [Pusillimonas sp. SM2304]
MTVSRHPPMDVESRLAQWVAGLSLRDIPDSVLAVARACMADGVGVMLAGSTTPLAEQCAALPCADGMCDIVGSASRADAPSAALLNGVAGHVLDFDDTSYAGIVHGTAAVLPAVLAVAQASDADGARLLEAFVAGVETEYALGLAMTDSLYDQGLWTTATLGVIGAAAGCAKLLGLDAASMAHAIRLAANMPIGLRITHGTSGKPYLCGMAARLGVELAYAAKAGITGQAGTFEKPRGYAATLNGGVFHAPAIDALGMRYALLDPGVAFKLRPMCSAMQAAVDAVIALRGQHAWTLDEVESINCYGTALVVSCLPYRLPAHPSEAQFCMPFAIACTLLHGDVRLEHLNIAALADPDLRQLMQRVELHEDENLVPPADIQTCPEAARVDIRLRDGRLLSHTVLAATGMPQRPASTEILFDKFMACATLALPSEHAQAIWTRLQRVEHLPHTRSLFDSTTSARRT